jgi:hypothetical protein
MTVIYSSYQKDLIDMAIKQYQNAVKNCSSSQTPTGSAIHVQINTPRDVMFAIGSQDSNSHEERCSEKRVAALVYQNVVPEAINADRGKAKTLVTVSKDGDAIPCRDCLKWLGRKLFEDSEQTAFPLDMKFLAVDAYKVIKKETTLADLIRQAAENDIVKQAQ